MSIAIRSPVAKADHPKSAGPAKVNLGISEQTRPKAKRTSPSPTPGGALHYRSSQSDGGANLGLLFVYIGVKWRTYRHFIDSVKATRPSGRCVPASRPKPPGLLSLSVPYPPRKGRGNQAER